MSERDEPNSESPLDRLIFFSAWIGVLGTIVLAGVLVWAQWANPHWNEVVFKHFPFAVGLPSAAVGAFTVVALFRTTEGKIKFQALGFKFEGASGPIVMWVMCFLAIVIATRILWPLTLAK